MARLLDLECKNRDHIYRERDEAIEAYYDQDIPVKAIAALVGVSDKTVKKWVNANRSENPRKQVRKQ